MEDVEAGRNMQHKNDDSIDEEDDEEDEDEYDGEDDESVNLHLPKSVVIRIIASLRQMKKLSKS